jgi:hypothetical protein
METKLSQRAQRALDLLKTGGEVVHRLERNAYNGREQFQTRFVLRGQVVRGLGFATRYELEEAGFRLCRVRSTSVSTYYRLAA